MATKPVLLLIAILPLLAGVALAGTTATPDAQTTGPEARLTAAAAESLARESVHFTVRNERGRTTIFPGVRLLDIEGDIQQPDRFRATILVRALLGEVEIRVIGIGDQFWLANPLTGGDRFEEQEVDSGLLALARPDSIVRLIPLLVDDLEDAGEETIDGVPVTLLTGNLYLDRIEEVAPDVPTNQINTDETLPVRIWIDEDNLIRRIRIDGPFLTYDDDDVVRVLDLTDYDEPVEIEPPI